MHRFCATAFNFCYLLNATPCCRERERLQIDLYSKLADNTFVILVIATSKIELTSVFPTLTQIIYFWKMILQIFYRNRRFGSLSFERKIVKQQLSETKSENCQNSKITDVKHSAHCTFSC